MMCPVKQSQNVSKNLRRIAHLSPVLLIALDPHVELNSDGSEPFSLYLWVAIMTSDSHPAAGHQAKLLSQVLVQEGWISAEQMAVALYDEERTGLPLEEILVLHGWVDSHMLDRALLKLCRQQLGSILRSHPDPTQPSAP
jgi:hypothetical protein